MSNVPNYKVYSDDELAEALENIDKKQFPHRFEELTKETQKRAALDRMQLAEQKRKASIYVPNHVPLLRRLKNILLSGAVLISGTFGLLQNDLAMTLCRRCEYVFHFSGWSAVCMYVALVLIAVRLIGEVVDHYDKRNNEHKYQQFFGYLMLPALCFYVLAFFLHSISDPLLSALLGLYQWVQTAVSILR